MTDHFINRPSAKTTGQNSPISFWLGTLLLLLSIIFLIIVSHDRVALATLPALIVVLILIRSHLRKIFDYSSQYMGKGFFRIWVALTAAWVVISFAVHIPDYYRSAQFFLDNKDVVNEEVSTSNAYHKNYRDSQDSQLTAMRNDLRNKGVFVGAMTDSEVKEDWIKRRGYAILERSIFLSIVKSVVPTFILFLAIMSMAWVIRGFRDAN